MRVAPIEIRQKTFMTLWMINQIAQTEKNDFMSKMRYKFNIENLTQIRQTDTYRSQMGSIKYAPVIIQIEFSP